MPFAVGVSVGRAGEPSAIAVLEVLTTRSKIYHWVKCAVFLFAE
jgi:hypothetical protein